MRACLLRFFITQHFPINSDVSLKRIAKSIISTHTSDTHAPSHAPSHGARTTRAPDTALECLTRDQLMQEGGERRTTRRTDLGAKAFDQCVVLSTLAALASASPFAFASISAQKKLVSLHGSL